MGLIRGSTRLPGWLARRYRGRRGWIGWIGRGGSRLARRIAARVEITDLEYQDSWGLRHRATLSDHMELGGFLGLAGLPEAAAARVRDGDWAVDVGANVGLVTGHLCRLVGSDGLVWAIEPVPRNIRRLRELRALNGLGQLLVIEGALGAETGLVALPLPSGRQSGWASFTKSYDTGDGIETRLWRMDDLVRERAGEGRAIGFMKIDVEGYEPQVVEGASETLASMRPWVLCEFNDILLRDAGGSARELMELWRSIGYRPAQGAELTGPVMDLLLEPV